jgi:hypothetical protein
MLNLYSKPLLYKACYIQFKMWYISFSLVQMVTRQTHAHSIVTDVAALLVTLSVKAQLHWWQQYENARPSRVMTAVQHAHNKLYPNESPLATRHSANDNTQNWFYPALPNKHTNTYTHPDTRAHSRFPRQPIKTAAALMQKSSLSCIRLTIKY